MGYAYAKLISPDWKLLIGKPQPLEEPAWQIYGLKNIDLEDTTLNFFKRILKYPNIQTRHRVFVLNSDETINYEIPQEDIIKDGISYKEGYNNGQRRTVELSLINIDGKYTPNINRLWYNTKILYTSGIVYEGNEYLFARGIYLITDFDYIFSNNDRKIVYSLKDKFFNYEGPCGTIIDSIEFKPGIDIDELLSQISNTGTADGLSYDLKPPLMNSDVSETELQQTIRIESGGKIGQIIDQVATQMNCEYFYNALGYLCFEPLDESLNDHEKPIIWSYTKNEIDQFDFKGTSELVNVIKVTGANIDGKIYSAVVKNENLRSNINIFRINERPGQTIQDENILSDDMAKERGEFELRKNAILAFQQVITVPFNPILQVNNLIEIDDDDLDLHNDKFLINSISYTSDSPQMQLEIININSLPIIGG